MVLSTYAKSKVLHKLLFQLWSLVANKVDRAVVNVLDQHTLLH